MVVIRETVCIFQACHFFSVLAASAARKVSLFPRVSVSPAAALLFHGSGGGVGAWA